MTLLSLDVYLINFQAPGKMSRAFIENFFTLLRSLKLDSPIRDENKHLNLGFPVLSLMTVVATKHKRPPWTLVPLIYVKHKDTRSPKRVQDDEGERECNISLEKPCCKQHGITQRKAHDNELEPETSVRKVPLNQIISYLLTASNAGHCFLCWSAGCIKWLEKYKLAFVTCPRQNCVHTFSPFVVNIKKHTIHSAGSLIRDSSIYFDYNPSVCFDHISRHFVGSLIFSLYAAFVLYGSDMGDKMD